MYKIISKSKFNDYFSLTKPGVLFANAITAGAGFMFASRGVIDIWLLVFLFLGSSLIIASACVINNVLDYDIDQKMLRTKNRAMVKKSIPRVNAVIFSIILGILGLFVLHKHTNNLVVLLGVFGFIDYVLLYGMLSKRLSWHGTLVGSLSGAVPIISGYVAVTGRIDFSAILLFLILFIWQMPEFYSIAIYRMKEYKKAKLPIISVVKGVDFTINYIISYTLLFVFVTLLLGLEGNTSRTYFIVMLAMGIRWIWIGILSLKAIDINIWARQMFKFSLVILLVFSFLISIDSWLP